MAGLLLAHISDLHVPGRWPLDPRRWSPGRIATAVHHLASRVGAHPVAVLRALVRDVAAAAPDHVALTGDVGVLALESEFARAQEELAPLLARPGFVTALPGNHDRVTRAGGRAFARAFGHLASSEVDLGPAPFPFVRVRGAVTLVGVDTADGQLGPTGRAGLARALAHPSAAGAPFRVLLLHHGPLGRAGGRDVVTRRMRDDRELLVAAGEGRVDLVLHGHIHEPFAWSVERAGHRFTVVGVGSSTLVRGDPVARAGFNLYRIEAGRLVGLERRAWSAASGAFDVRAPIDVRPEPRRRPGH
jgi:3',5'-cyclic AMP phosphodiesterase CpdA